MKKILHISKYYYPFLGGIENTARDCVTSLLGEFEQRVICFNTSNRDEEGVIDDVEIIRCGSQMKINSQAISLSLAKKCKKIAKDWKPDYIIIHFPNPYGVSQVLKYFKKTKIIVYWHSDIVKQKVLGKFFYFQNRKLLLIADRVIATSPNYIEGSPLLSKVKEKCIVIPSCVNEKRLGYNEKNEKAALEIKKKTKNKIICFAYGRHVKYKGFKYLVEASRYLDDRFVFYIAGSGKMTNELKKQARNDNKIIFLNEISNEELKNYLIATDIFCFPSITKNEAYGLALAESMFFGNPAITFSILGSGVNYVCRGGKEGIEVKNVNSKKYAEAIRKLGEDKELREMYGRNAMKRAQELFTYEIYSMKIRTLMK